MDLAAFIDWFIHPDRKEDPSEYKKTRLFVRASLLTSLFSNSYIWLSVYFEFYLAVKLMIFNVVGFLVLSLLAKTKIDIKVLGHLYVFVGAFAVIVISYYSGGMWSAVYPWIISIPVLALLVVDKSAGVLWGILSFGVMVWMGVLALQGVELPLEFNTSMKTLWFVTVVPGLLLIIMVVSMVFESTQSRALKDLEEQNKVLEEQKGTIEEQSDKLQKLIEEKDHIIRILAHDLKNPLANITTISNILKEEDEISQQKKFIAMIEQVSAKAQGLVDNVLKMAILEQGAIRLQLERLDVVKVVKEAVKELKEQASRKSIAVSFTSDTAKSLVTADQTYLLLIFENLLSNALKFSDKGTKVEIQIHEAASNIQIKVMDEGPGIKPEEEGLLFEQFTKLSARPTGEESSTGLGLSLVKKYVEQIEGKIWYDSQDSKGATFVVELPLAS